MSPLCQVPGPRWNLRQWAEYWRDRKPEAGPGLNPAAWVMGAACGGTDLAGLTGLMAGPAASAVAARFTSSSSHGEGAEGGDMDDEADSAWVHGKG